MPCSTCGSAPSIDVSPNAQAERLASSLGIAANQTGCGTLSVTGGDDDGQLPLALIGGLALAGGFVLTQGGGSSPRRRRPALPPADGNGNGSR